MREKTEKTWRVPPRFLACPGGRKWKEGAAICRDGKHREHSGFWDEMMSLVSDMVSLKDL